MAEEEAGRSLSRGDRPGLSEIYDEQVLKKDEMKEIDIIYYTCMTMLNSKERRS